MIWAEPSGSVSAPGLEAYETNQKLAATIRKLEEEYDNELISQEG